MRRAQRLLPDSWQGDGREARWRRSRGRKILTGLLAGVAVLAVVGAVRPADPPTQAVTVVTRDLSAGERLTAADLRRVQWSTTDRLPGALTTTAATGTVLTAPIRSGEPVTAARVRAARSWPALPKGRVIVGVTSTDRTLVRVLQPGDRVDLIDTARTRTIATSVRVMSVSGPSGSAAKGDTPALVSTSDAPAVLVAVTPAQAAAVGSAAAARSGGLGGGIQLALRAGA